jgi:hypothetical protein
MALDAHEFIRRFLLHSLPDGFHRIRHYGFLANGHRQSKLALIRRLLDQPARRGSAATPISQRLRDLMGIDVDRCPRCNGTMRVIDILPRPRSPPTRPFSRDRP